MSKSKSKAPPQKIIAMNRKATHEYFIEQRFEAGLVLEGWEVKSLRAGRAQIAESYVRIINGEAWLIGSHISPLQNVGEHLNPDPTRSRKLLLHQKELNKLIGLTERKGYALIPLNLHWYKGFAKLDIALAKGKKTHDKRATIKDRETKLEARRAMKSAE